VLSATKILTVDDRPENLLALKAVLSGCAYEVVEAQSGLEALSLVKIHDFAVILLDVQMPNMDGFETALRIRKESRSSATPIIFVTALHKTESYKNKGYGAGAVDYLFKPLNIDILKAKISVFVELQRKNEENLKQAELLKKAELREQENKLLKAAVDARDEFLAMAAHELRTPLTPLSLLIQAFVQMFKDNTIQEISKERMQELLETSEGQVHRLTRIVDELGEVARMTSGKLQIVKENFDLAPVIRQVCSTFSEEIEKSGSHLSMEISDNLVGFWDKYRIEQVIVNLLTNALKYGGGKPIKISAYLSNNTAILEVQDQGIGIRAEDHKRIFHRFERAVSAKHYSGLGIGLYIVESIVRLHGGRVRVESLFGFGSKFVIEIPLIHES